MEEQETSAVRGHRRRAAMPQNSFGAPVSQCHRQSWASSTRDTGLGGAGRDLGSWIRELGEKGPPASLVMAKCDKAEGSSVGTTLQKAAFAQVFAQASHCFSGAMITRLIGTESSRHRLWMQRICELQEFSTYLFNALEHLLWATSLMTICTHFWFPF